MSNQQSEQHLIYFNGLNENGDYFTPPLTSVELTRSLSKPDPTLAKELAEGVEYAPSRRVRDVQDLSQTGWGLIFPGQADPSHVEAVLDHLAPLLTLRQAQASPGGDRYFRIFQGDFGYQPSDTRRTFLKRLGVGPADVVDPREGVPYYLLIIGSPTDIPYRFQFELDVQFAVGRLDFGQDYAAYAHYAQNVVAVETGQFERARTAAFFGVTHDEATRLSANYLIKPLFDNMVDSFGDPESDSAWSIQEVSGAKATRAQLEQLAGGDQTPALLFTASHGMAFTNGHPNQLAHQGALVCQDWRSGPITEDHYFAGDHVSQTADLRGQILFSFACYGAGTPSRNDFFQIDQLKHQKYPGRYPPPEKMIAPETFVAGLPTKMLGHPQGALAFIGHVERAWSFSFGGRSQNISSLDSTLTGLLMGDRIGFATDPMNLKYATLATEVTSEMQELEHKQDVEAYIKAKETELVSLWTEHNDARNYIVIGDPAVALVATAESVAFDETTPTVSTTAAAPASPPAAGEVGHLSSQEYGPLDLFRQPHSAESTEPEAGGTAYDLTTLQRSIEQNARLLADKLAAAVEDVTSLEIKTYTSDDIKRDAVYDRQSRSLGQAASLHAYTHISFDGDVTSIVPRQADEEGSLKIDRELWAAHQEMIQLASANRIEFLRVVGDITGTIIRSLR